MERVGFDGFEWEEVRVLGAGGSRPHHELYLYTDGKARRTYLKDYIVQLAGWEEGDKLQLYAQGTSIYMLKKSKIGVIKVGRKNGRNRTIGGSDFYIKLKERANTTEFEVIEAADGYVLFRPIR